MEQIKIIASASKKVGRKTEAIFEIKIDGAANHKYVSVEPLKEKGVIKRISQFKKAQEWMNTEEGRAWALETPHVRLL